MSVQYKEEQSEVLILPRLSFQEALLVWATRAFVKQPRSVLGVAKDFQVTKGS